MNPFDMINPFSNKRRQIDAMIKATPRRQASIQVAQSMPDGLFTKCPECTRTISNNALEKSLMVCPSCGHHFPLAATSRLASIFDDGCYEELDQGLVGCDPLSFPGYSEKAEGLQITTGLEEAVITATGTIMGHEAVAGAFDTRFLMGSMGVAVGEKIARAIELAGQRHLPLVIFAASGGARMQEGIFSLMQMASTSAAVSRYREAGAPFISVLCDPTMGGVTASFASLGDFVLAEPGALVGFAGPRVIKQTIHEDLPTGFQRSESLLSCGFVDAIVPRPEMRSTIAKILELARPQASLADDAGKAGADSVSFACLMPHDGLEDYDAQGIDAPLSPGERVALARDLSRPDLLEYFDALFEGFFEQHGDRQSADDQSMVGGVARFHGMPITVIGQRKGHDLKTNTERNFGMPSPEGYRKALRLARDAERFSRPIVAFIDTPGAYPGREAEEHGQADAIARCLEFFSSAKTPIVSVFIGEGGSGGALALGICDLSIMLENAIFSILSPEGFASILWKDPSRSDDAASLMKLTASDLYDAGIADCVIAEGSGGIQHNKAAVMQRLDAALGNGLFQLAGIGGAALADRRYRRYRSIASTRIVESAAKSPASAIVSPKEPPQSEGDASREASHGCAKGARA